MFSVFLIGSLSTRVFAQIFILLISSGEKILRNVNVVVRGQVKIENSSFLAAKLPNVGDGQP